MSRRRRWLWVLFAVLMAAVGAVTYLRSRLAYEVPSGFSSIKALSVYQQPEALERAWALPVASKYPRPPLWQSNPSACGPTAVANVLHSTGALEATADSVAEFGAGCFKGVCFGGLTLEQLATATRGAAPKWQVTALHTLTLEQFRDELRQANALDRRLIINFHRGPLFGTGGGHHSPIAGYLEADDLVFVLDVNERYQPWLVPAPRLYEAMHTVDPSSGELRGLLRLELR